MSEFYKKLIKVQSVLNAPKGQFNKFGNYNYRSCEDIMGAVKPLLVAEGLFQSITDEVQQVGDRFYIKATVTVTDGENTHSVSALARESLDKKGMDSAQVTGAASSYARKYALNGMYNIDDTKDADTNEMRQQASKIASNQVKKEVINYDEILASAKNTMSGANLETLADLFQKNTRSLKGSQSHLAELIKFKDEMKAKLEDN